MAILQNAYKINFKYIVICFTAVFLTFFFHEGTHYITGKLLGYDMWMTLNSAGLTGGQVYDKEWHNNLVSISGPIFTLIQAVLFYYIIKKTNAIKWYPFIFIAALMRLFAALTSAIINPNDEARVSEWLGLGKMTLHVIICLFLIYLVVKVTRHYKITWKFNLATYVLLSSGVALIVFTEQYVLK